MQAGLPVAREWPRLVAVEGPSGCGKSSLMPELEASLTALGLRARAVSNNDLQRWTELIRGLAKTPLAPLSLAYATAGARADLRESYGPDTLLVCDRYVLSTLVYQGYAGVPLETLRYLNTPLVAGTRTFMLSIDLVELERRRSQRQRPPTDWFKKALSAADEITLYESAASEFEVFGQTVTRVDASTSSAEIAAALVPEIVSWLEEGGA